MVGKYATETLRADNGGIERAAQILRGGGLVAVPTETVYGLAARADDDEAVARIYAAKGRPSFNPLIVHVASLSAAERLAVFSEAARALARQYWPGPLTLVLSRQRGAGLAAAVTAGLDTVALRMPSHPAMRDLLEFTGLPLAAPSANRSGFVSPTSAAHVLGALDGRIDAVIDGGPSEAGIESTIVAVGEDGSRRVLRPGPILLEDIARPDAGGRIEAPGQLASHYSPGKPVRLDATEVAPDDFVIGFGAMEGDCTLSEAGDLAEAAARLYACFHQGAISDKPRIAVAPIPEEGIGIAINDRLRRAATPPD
ncbi:L-threonylcarbamoyladenylate synthase [Qipengyuania sp. XHP0207]|uniref:L-threonylcarbamoyladenylate synthase n=1 Tax=Qipengyuania sp. XHP0207 TaxID=3038078 RepID=UPI00241D1414|nr:L-threonylcarbamoyladenylate synthase [Qipengyuania sp. XHP0207]MDG5748102.1 L-threonylcarbamoyladenylate synthase [Qipengyuania sp. XHP0207]